MQIEKGEVYKTDSNTDSVLCKSTQIATQTVPFNCSTSCSPLTIFCGMIYTQFL